MESVNKNNVLLLERAQGMFDIGHLHPMTVHFPIAIIMIGFITDLILSLIHI